MAAIENNQMPNPSVKTASLHWLAPLALAFLCLFGPVRPAIAHALPGTTINIMSAGNSLNLTISLPLHELDLAMPGGTGVVLPASPGVLVAAQMQKLTAYFGDHLSIKLSNGAELEAKLTSAQIEKAHDDHVGTFDLLVITVTAPLSNSGTAIPATLIYDAVIHEVRNHIATVMLQSPDHIPVFAGYIRFDPDLGRAAPFALLPLP